MRNSASENTDSASASTYDGVGLKDRLAGSVLNLAPLVLLIVSFLVFRGLGFLGVPLFAEWHISGRLALALMFLFTASAHFTGTKRDLIAMVPPAFPQPGRIVFATGLLEILGACGILIGPLKNVAGLCLIILLIAMFPANIRAAKSKIPFRGRSPTPLRLRAPIQLLFIGFTWWSTLT